MQGDDLDVDPCPGEFDRLGEEVYLDHAGATLHARSQLEECMAILTGSVLGNSHSGNAAGKRTAAAVEAARDGLLQHFNVTAETHAVVFTSGATAGLKLIGECFPWRAGGAFVHTLACHTSVLGIRELAAAGAAAVHTVSWPSEQCPSTPAFVQAAAAYVRAAEGAPVLVAIPGECNFSGYKFDLSAVQALRELHSDVFVLLDAAKLVATSALDLSRVPADAVVLSWYKMAGYPTGLGALILRHDRAHLLRKTYFGGGTVEAVASGHAFHVPRRDIAARLQDGTMPFLQVACMLPGMRWLQRVRPWAERRTRALAHYLAAQLSGLRHANGAPVVQLYGWQWEAGVHSADPDRVGSIVAFNALHSDGSVAGYSAVGKLAALHHITLRTGCFCNPGACQHFLRLTLGDVRSNWSAGHVCWDDHDVVEGRPTGAVRVSFGCMSRRGDADAVVQLLKRYFMDDGKAARDASAAAGTETADMCDAGGLATPGVPRLIALWVYPVKSCAGMRVTMWPVAPHGLLLDREWAVVTPAGKALRQKEALGLCRVQPAVDWVAGVLHLTEDGTAGDALALPLGDAVLQAAASAGLRPAVGTAREFSDAHQDGSVDGGHRRWRSVRVCGVRCEAEVDDCPAVRDWLTKRVGQACTLARRPTHTNQAAEAATSGTAGPPSRPSIGFANQAQFLLVSAASVRDLQRRAAHDPAARRKRGDGDLSLAANEAASITVECFRPNLVVDGVPAFAEDAWAGVKVGSVQLRHAGPCSRCSMVNIDARAGTMNGQALMLLAQFRMHGSNVLFGQYFAREDAQFRLLREGDPLDVRSERAAEETT